MIVRALLRNPALYALVAISALAAAYFLGGLKGLQGMSMGIFATLFNLWAMWKIIGLIGKASQTGRAQRWGAIWTVLAFFVKLPLFVALGIVAQRLGGAAPGCFLAGLGLVYCALVGWALTRD